MDLIAAVADQTDLPRAKATEVVDAVFGAIEGALKNKEEVRLRRVWHVRDGRAQGRHRPQSTHRRGDGDSGFDHRPLQGRKGVEGRGSVITAGG